MISKISHHLAFLLLLAVVFLFLGGCGPLAVKEQPRFFWPPPPDEPKIEYINFYYSDEDLLRGVDRRLEAAILGKRKPVRILFQPFSVASDGKGRIFVTDFNGLKVTILDFVNHTTRLLQEETKGQPQKVVVDKQGEIWILNGAERIVYHYAADEKKLATLKLAGVERAASLAVDSVRQRLYLSDVPNHRICVFDYQGTKLSSIGVRGREPGELNYPTDLDLDSAGNLYVVDSMNARIQVFSPEGVFIRAFGERGTALGSFASAKGIAVSPSNLVYVTDATQNKIVIFNSEGDYLLTLGGGYVFDGTKVQPGGLNFPVGIDVDAKETIIVADFFNGMIHEFQYLSPDYLARKPIRAGQVYRPTPTDFKPRDQKNALEFPLPATGTGAGAENTP